MRRLVPLLLVACGRSPTADLPAPPAADPDCEEVAADYEKELQLLRARLDLLEAEHLLLQREKAELDRRLDALDAKAK